MGLPQTHCVTEGVAAGWALSDGSGVCVTREFATTKFIHSRTTLTNRLGYTDVVSFTVWLAKLDLRVQEIVGGTMNGTNTQPEDPLFFMHLANMDRLLALWQDYQGADEGTYEALGVADVALNMQHAADGSVLTAYFGTDTVLASSVFLTTAMPGGAGYAYGNDDMAGLLSVPKVGSWDLITPGGSPKYQC